MPKGTNKIIPVDKDARRKLTLEDRQDIHRRYNGSEQISQRELAREYGVSRRTIQFIVDPDKLKANLVRRRERIDRGERQTTTEAQTLAMRRYRARARTINPVGYIESERKYKGRSTDNVQKV